MMSTEWRRYVVTVFEAFVRVLTHLHLEGIHATGLPKLPPPESAASGATIVFAANHISWWDGFILRDLQRRIGIKGPLATFMLDDRLRRFPFFRYMGVIGLRPTPGSVRFALRQVEDLRRHGPVTVAIFPQGGIWPSWKRPLGFRRGVAHFARWLAPAIVLPVGLHLEPLSGRRPTLFIAAGPPFHVSSEQTLDVTELEKRVESTLDFIHEHLARYGEAAVETWPSAHSPVPEFRATSIPPYSVS